MKHQSFITRVAVAAMLVGASVGAVSSSAAAQLPDFRLNPPAAGLGGGPFHADNGIVSNFTVFRTSGNSFSTTGYLPFQTFQLRGLSFEPLGLNQTFGLYLQYTATGTTTVGDPLTMATAGTFETFNYTLFGHVGTAEFGFDAAGNPTTNAFNPVALGSGSLVRGVTGSGPLPPSFFSYTAVNLTFKADPAFSAFFASPMPFYEFAFLSFINSPTEVATLADGFTSRQGGGSFNFAADIGGGSTVPEPATFGLLLTGLSAMAGVTIRRRKQA